jgi:hypothetical protein
MLLLRVGMLLLRVGMLLFVVVVRLLPEVEKILLLLEVEMNLLLKGKGTSWSVEGNYQVQDMLMEQKRLHLFEGMCLV